MNKIVKVNICRFRVLVKKKYVKQSCFICNKVAAFLYIVAEILIKLLHL